MQAPSVDDLRYAVPPASLQLGGAPHGASYVYLASCTGRDAAVHTVVTLPTWRLAYPT
ncbi:hypothetical protein [Mycolicibacterium setense]|uniref:hypothetical protein n=1 Tax=Mycolicibacterium setense TaxID=431269 RepID=UPI000ABF45FF|nr:hypothetical protein [Mycolicibacterium setense]